MTRKHFTDDFRRTRAEDHATEYRSAHAPSR